MRWAGHVAREREMRCSDRILMGKPEGKRPLGKPRRRWENNIKMYIQEVRWGGGMDWIDLVQNWDSLRGLVNVVMNSRVP
jgi:hypothetical protein